jgi:ATP-dependent DNA helicase PIF1
MEGNSFFFTGAAGTGKSYALREIIRIMKAFYSAEELQIVAPTGMAALALGGCTIHSFAGIGLGAEDAEYLVDKIKKNRKSLQRWRSVRVLIIDEVSMLSGELLDKLEYIANNVRPRSELPFGGIQIVLCGDFFQLPPIGTNAKQQNNQKPIAKASASASFPAKSSAASSPFASMIVVSDNSKSTNASPASSNLFAFSSKSWKRLVKQTFKLTQVFRQIGDLKFVQALNEVREGEVSDQVYQQLINCVGRELPFDHGVEATRLYPTKNQVAMHNSQRLNKITGSVMEYKAQDRSRWPDSPQLKQIRDGCPAPEFLHLKIGAQVVLLKNFPDDELVNGSRGTVTSFVSKAKTEIDTEDETNPVALSKNTLLLPLVTFENGVTRLIQSEKWSIVIDDEELASREQIPLDLAWALSIHKSQGMTIAQIEVSLRSVFECGQAYVALSRVTSLEGLKISEHFRKEVIRAHPDVVTFYKSLVTI